MTSMKVGGYRPKVFSRYTMGISTFYVLYGQMIAER
jgi:hypothetical protein